MRVVLSGIVLYVVCFGRSTYHLREIFVNDRGFAMCLRYKHERNNPMKSASASDDSFNDLRWSLEAVTWLRIENLKDGQQKAAWWFFCNVYVSRPRAFCSSPCA